MQSVSSVSLRTAVMACNLGKYQGQSDFRETMRWSIPADYGFVIMLCRRVCGLTQHKLNSRGDLSSQPPHCIILGNTANSMFGSLLIENI